MLALLLLPCLLFAKTITLAYLEDKPRSIEKDYYIWRFLDQNITTPKEAQRALEMCFRVNRKIFFRYAKKIKDPNISKVSKCMQLSLKDLLKEDASCLAVGMSIYRFYHLPLRKKIKVYKKLQPFEVKKHLRYLVSKDPYPLLLKKPKEFLYIFNRCGKECRRELFDRVLSKKFIIKLSSLYGFSSFVKKALLEDLEKIEYSLLRANPKDFDAKSAFYTGLIAYKKELYNIANQFFHQSYQKSYFQSHKDRALFWQYKSTHNQEYLNQLLTSWDLNFYTVLAHEIKRQPVKNYFIPLLQGKKDINLSNPFVWYKIRQKIRKENLKQLKSEFAYKNTQNIFAIIEEKASHYKKHIFILPWQKLLKDQTKSQKALIYALARQESRFIPSSISPSYALGAMQFMPFLARYTAKKLHIKHFDLDMMFNEKIALLFAKDHLKFLSKLHHPLLIAYAYNGGIGYTKRVILPLFKKYEPLLAMELISYEETKEYGKKVLTNYYIYSLILGTPVKMTTLLQNLE